MKNYNNDFVISKTGESFVAKQITCMAMLFFSMH